MTKPGGDFVPPTRDWLFIKPSPDPELVKAVARQQAGLPQAETKAGRILRIVAAEFGVTVELMLGTRRERQVHLPRFAAVALNPDSKAPKDAKVLSKPFHLRDLVNEVEKMLQAA